MVLSLFGAEILLELDQRLRGSDGKGCVPTKERTPMKTRETWLQALRQSQNRGSG